jgi:hypothetical protein
MLRKMKISPFQPGRFWMLFAVTSMLVLVTACGGAAATPANPVDTTGNVVPTSAPVDVPTQVSTVANTSSGKADACTYLTQDDVSKALGITVDLGVSSGLGGVCTYTTTDLKVDLTVTHSGGTKYLADTLVKLGDLALVVPGLGDQAFFNTNSFVNALLVRKGDVAFIVSVSDLTHTTFTPEDLQAKEKALTEQMFTHLP